MRVERQTPATTSAEPNLAFDRRGTGVPIVLLSGLTFERRTWRPIVERLGAGVCSVAIDLPVQGDSGGAPRDLAGVAAAVHRLVGRLGIAEPVVVGEPGNRPHRRAAPVGGPRRAVRQGVLLGYSDELTRSDPVADRLRAFVDFCEARRRVQAA